MKQQQYNKFLILNFKNAGLFRKHNGTKDKIFDISSKRDRKNEPEFIEPITEYQVSNVLHVLFGERPVSSIRESLYSRNEYLVDKARNSFLRIESYTNDKGKYQQEIKQLNKPFWNSWNPQSFMNWERTRKILGEELFTKFSETLEEVFKISLSKVSFVEVKEKVLATKDKRLDAIFDELISNGKKSLYNSFFGIKTELSDINKNSKTMLTIIRGVDTVFKLDGQILVPVSDEDIEKIRANKGTATILDGGLVSIKDLIDSNFINTERMGFTKLSEIKTTKI
jgi:hypothetical protein